MKIIHAASALLLFGVYSCTNDLTDPNYNDLVAEISTEGNYFGIDGPNAMTFNFNQHSTWSGTVAVNGYDGPLVKIPLQLFDGDRLLETGWTDENGQWELRINHTDAMDLKVVCDLPTIAGTYPVLYDDFQINISPNQGQSHQSSSLSTVTFKTNQTSTSFRGNTNWYDDRSYSVQSSRDGKNLPTFATPDTLSDIFLTSIANSVPEQFPVGVTNPELLADGITSLHLSEDGDVWITYVSEGAGYMNVLGIFTYDDNAVPTSTSDIDTIWTVFENFSGLYSGGGLLPGDKVYIGSYPQGTNVGFALIANGYNGTGAQFKQNNTYYSIPDLNTQESNPDKRQHNILLYDGPTNRFVIGFEDLYRSNGSSDEDFNDALFFCSSNPPGAIDTSNVTPIVHELEDCDYDGTPDLSDIAPCDPKFATEYTTGGKLMFEDLYPYLGDYDFNDIVVEYDAVAWKNTAGATTKMSYTFVLKADGGSRTNGFGLNFDELSSADVSNISFGNSEGSLESGSKAVFILTENMSWAGTSMVNTSTSGNQSTDYPTYTLSFEIANATTSDIFWGADLNPFIFQNTTNNLRNEVHLKYKRPTSKCALDSVGTGDDITLLEPVMFSGSSWQSGTNAMRFWAEQLHSGDSTILPATNFTYTDKNGYPWAMHVDKSVKHAQERVNFNTAYPSFSNWVNSRGTEGSNWFSSYVLEFIFP